jgi:hypothetical protein
MRTVLQQMVAALAAVSASTLVAAPHSEPLAASVAPAKIKLRIAPEIDRRWPELRVNAQASGVAELAEPADLLVTTDDELGDFVELRPQEAGSATDARLPLIRLGRLSSGDAQAALTRALTLLQRQKAVLGLSDAHPSDLVEACKVDPRDPDNCLPTALVRAVGPMLGTSVRNNSTEPRFVALLETSSSLGIGAAVLRGRETAVRLAPGEKLLIEPVPGTGLKGTSHEIVVVSERAFDPAALVQPSPYGSSATCFVRLYADCIASVLPLQTTTGLSATRFTYDAQEQDPGPAMGGGETAARGDADWMVELYSTLSYSPEEIEADGKLPAGKRQYLAKRSLEERAHACGGTMLAADLVLTAAHCVATGRFQKPNEARLFTDRRVRIGSLRLGRGGETRAIVGAVIHDGYTGRESGIPNDIALLLVKSDERIRLSARPLKLAATAPAPGTTLTGLGWGYTQSVAPGANLLVSMSNEVQRNPQLLQQASLEVLANPVCNRRLQGKLRPGMLCLVTPKAVAARGGAPTFSCRGDSGGPLVRNYGSDREELVGLTSWSRGCGYKDTPSVYTDASYFARWVEAARRAIRPGAIVRVGDPAGSR